VYTQSQAVFLSIGSYAFDCMRGSRSQSCVCSIVGMALDRRALNREMCARSHVTSLKSHGASELAMVARVTRTSRADEACARSCPLGSSALRSIAPSVLDHTSRG
jgi:hypothetical protein